MSYDEKLVKEILAKVDIKINGKRPWDIKVYNPDFYSRILSYGSLALGESYMDGWWDCNSIDTLISRILRNELNKKINFKNLIFPVIKSKLFNLQNLARAFQIGERHYDIGNEFYKNMLDKRMIYSCGYWKNTKNLDQAQTAKLDLICRKIGLKKGMKILDIGCGWGGFAKYAAEKYNVEVIGVTVSKEQLKLAKEVCNGLPVKLLLQDYRTLNGEFDHIISIGMFEHVGYKNYQTYMNVVNRCLKDDGLFLLHTIGGNTSHIMTEPWIDKYIFPNSLIPSAIQIIRATEGSFVLEDWHNFGADYDKTLMAWYNNFKKNWVKIQKNYNYRFYRMWTYYLLSCAGSFRARYNQIWQIVFSKKGLKNGYVSVR